MDKQNVKSLIHNKANPFHGSLHWSITDKIRVSSLV